MNLQFKDRIEMIKKVISFIFGSKIFLSFSSFYLFLLFYFIHNSILLFSFNKVVNYILYILIGFFISVLGLFGIYSKKETDYQKEIISVHLNEFSFIPIYLSLIIISLNINNFIEQKIEVLFFFVILFFIWLKLENVTFFSFFWLFLGYHFYKVKTQKSTYTLISKKKDIKDKDLLTSLILKRINNFTFLEVKKNE